jgi:hypothetical protein
VDAFEAAWKQVDPDMYRYKGWQLYERLIAAALDAARNPVRS